MKEMKWILRQLMFSALLTALIFTGADKIARAAATDVVLARLNTSTISAAALVMDGSTGDILGSAGLLNGLGTISRPWQKGAFTTHPALGVNSVAANTTLTAASSAFTHCTNATAVITLANATTAGNGSICFVKNAAGAGNVSCASASTIDGAASVNATINETKRFYALSGAWFTW